MNLPPYTIKRSPRARHVRFRVTAADGLCVTIPRGFDPAGVPELVAEKQVWYEKVFRELVEKAPPPIPADYLPGKLDLAALGENWHVSYQDRKERGSLLMDLDNLRLTYSAADHSQERVFTVLRHWLKTRAKSVLEPQAFALADELGFEITRVTIRNQRSRWGSCTSKKTLSLNLKLLFLDPEQVRHVLVHEFCHTVHLNHSPAFWSLVARFEPDYKTMTKRTKKDAWRQVPQWV
jgi:predicted metal-dependent hydrolase